MQQRLDANIQLLDSQAGALISRHLQNEEQDLTNNLRIIQQSMSLRYPRCESMVTLLNFFGQPRDEVLSNLFEHLKANFDELLRSMVDVEIARLLDSSKALLTSPSLRFIPIALIKQLKRKLPDEVMDMVIQEQLQQVSHQWQCV